MSYFNNNSNNGNQSLFVIAKESLTVSLLKLRTSSQSKSTVSTLQLIERIKSCRGIELSLLIEALPHSGLRPELLEFLEISPFLEKYWKEVCLKEFSRAQPNIEESWRQVYLRQQESSNSKMVEAGLRLRNSYKGEENKIHQLKTISTIPSRKRPRFTTTQGVTTKKPTSLMEKARSEAIMSATRTTKSQSKNKTDR